MSRKIILIVVMLLLAVQTTAAWADDQPTDEQFQRIGCTQAVAWAAAEFRSNQPPGTVVPADSGWAETTAIKWLSRRPDSPCFRGGESG